MPSRQTLPTMWLMTDRRIADLRGTIARVPRGGGVVLRHHQSDIALAEEVVAWCGEAGLMLAIAGDVALARAVGAAMVHNPERAAAGLLVSRSVHSPAEAIAARGADAVFVSPVFPTPSHPGAVTLGVAPALALAALARAPAIALGGMDRARGKAAIAAGFHGWAGIAAWSRDGDLAP